GADPRSACPQYDVAAVLSGLVELGEEPVDEPERRRLRRRRPFVEELFVPAVAVLLSLASCPAGVSAVGAVEVALRACPLPLVRFLDRPPRDRERPLERFPRERLCSSSSSGSAARPARSRLANGSLPVVSAGMSSSS